MLGSKVPVYFLPVKLSLSEAHRQAADRGIAPNRAAPLSLPPDLVGGQAQIWFANRTYNVNTQEKVAVVLSELNQRGLVQWQDYATEPFAAQDFDYQALPPNATFADLVYPFDDEKNVTSLASDFADWLTRSYHLTLYRNPDLKLVSEVGESKETSLIGSRAPEAVSWRARLRRFRPNMPNSARRSKTASSEKNLSLKKSKPSSINDELKRLGGGSSNCFGASWVEGKRASAAP